MRHGCSSLSENAASPKTTTPASGVQLVVEMLHQKALLLAVQLKDRQGPTERAKEGKHLVAPGAAHMAGDMAEVA